MLWYDYETTGTDAARDRPAQFAALRTDMDLRPLGEPATLYCVPAPDVLPHPEACLIAQTLLSEIIGQPVQEHCHHGSHPRCRFQISA